MEYNNLRNKLNKFCNGGKITRYQLGGMMSSIPGAFDGQSDENGNVWDATLKMWKKDPNKMKFNNPSIIDQQQIDSAKKFGVSFSSGDENDPLGKTTTTFGNNGAIVSENSNQNSSVPEQNISSQKQADVQNTPGSTGMSQKAAMGIGIAAKVGVGAINMADNLLMGDKNFGAQSAAADSVVHGTSAALMASGNPYAMSAGAALEVANFATKATGQTLQGFDVDINSSGYGTMGHQESKSSRDWLSFIGLGGLNRGAMDRKLAKRNEQAQMAMKAAEVTDTVRFEQEARMNSVDNVLRNNQIALAGGVDTSLLGS